MVTGAEGGLSRPAITRARRRQNLRLTARGAAVVAVISGAIGGGIGSLADRQPVGKAVAIEAAENGVSPQTILGEGLRSPSTLKGIESRVSSKEKQELKDSTVTILERPLDKKFGWSAICTGVKVSMDRASYILSAGHCLSAGWYAPPGVKTGNVLPTSGGGYSIGSARAKLTSNNTGTPIASVTAVSQFLMDGPDLELLKVRATQSYDTIPSIPVDKRPSTPPPKGEQVALYALPGSVSQVAISGLGTYLGRIGSVDGSNNTFDVVGYNVRNAKNDVCQHGGSGSEFEAADGYISGPLRLGAPTTAIHGLPPVDNLLPENTVSYRLLIEQQTGVNVSGYDELCGYVVPPQNSFKELVQGFNTSITP